jgi:hypothetical protein
MHFNPSGVLLVLAATPFAIADGGFWETCPWWVYGDGTMFGNCLNDAQVIVTSELNLNDCITNVNGVMFVSENHYVF